jgi:hypothetical protein
MFVVSSRAVHPHGAYGSVIRPSNPRKQPIPQRHRVELTPISAHCSRSMDMVRRWCALVPRPWWEFQCLVHSFGFSYKKSAIHFKCLSDSAALSGVRRISYRDCRHWLIYRNIDC